MVLMRECDPSSVSCADTFSRKGRRMLDQALPTWVALSAWALRAA